ncbi:hypothetical protein PHYPSEUDO_011073 [Phytophthora pseudosyringae]|uniref:Uncharacterized protein n=1 Tax=Phytophthora pseudosyringae TaxID=221518 RepID=A0A8T1VCB5_9STRA|nr:hypothetical protein PHYPSEUDO_011073 [Phytophthora pseudosyringae]
MAEVAAFPALARAKKLFLRRKRAAGRREAETHAEDSTPSRPRKGPSASKPERDQGRRQEPPRTHTAHRCSASLVAFCSDFDEQLRLVSSDLLLLNTSVRREYQRESLALEKLTSELQDGEVNGVEPRPTGQRDPTPCRIRLRTRKPSITLRVVPQKVSHPQQPPTGSKTLSRPALLVHQAVKACVLQSYARFYLYRCLYTGGPSQLVAAGQLATRCRRARAFRHWRRVVTQRSKLRLRCRRAQQRVEHAATSFARSRAFEVVETEGKYAMAKEFHQSKLLAQSLRAWLGWYQSSTSKPVRLHP